MQRNEKRNLPQRTTRRTAMLEEMLHGMRRANPCFRPVHVRIGQIRRHGIRVVDHFWRDVGMVVETDRDRHVLSDTSPDAPKELAFTVFEVFSYHGAGQ